MNDKVHIHTTITKKADKVLTSVGGPKGKGDLISKLALQLEGGDLQQIVIDKYPSLSRTEDEIIFIDNDPISALQGGIFKNAVTLIVGNAGTGKFSIIANMILELSLSQRHVLLVTPKTKDKVEKALKTIFVVRNKKVPHAENAITLDLKITKPSNLHDLSETLDRYTNKPILVLDHLEEMIDFDPQRIKKTEWQFFSSCLKRNKITAIATASVNKETIVSNAVLDFESIFYLAQTPVLMDGKSRLARYIITFKSPKGTIHPAEFQLLENWQIRLDEKKSIFVRPNALQESGGSESLKRIARDSIPSSVKPDTPDTKTEPPVSGKPIVSRILARDETVLFDPESNRSANLEIAPVAENREKIEKTAEAPIAKTGPRDASPAEIAMKIDMMKKAALSFPNSPTNGKQIVNQSAPFLTEVLLNDFTAESLHIFTEKYKSSGKYDELVAHIAASLPAILKTREEEKSIQPEQQACVKPAISGKQSILSGSKKKIQIALEANGGVLNRKQISEKTGILVPNLTGPLQKMKESKIVSIDTEKWPHVVSLNKEKVIKDE
ncbi:hypothetical protein KKB43_02760 [Patescibacteria group bacterium]|nr:hypothetical protein [Patescibacteria group bacterium]